MSTMTNPLNRFARAGTRLALPALLVVALAACDSSPTDDNGDHGHAEGERVEIQTRGASAITLAVWTDEDGWTDADGASITELPDPVGTGGGGLLPLQAAGAHAALTVQFYFANGDAVPKGTIAQDGETGERECTEYSVRYYVDTDDTDVIAWPNIQHPDADDGQFQFARRADDELVGIFHCDHIHLYPESEGTVDIDFHLWHNDHSDVNTDPIRVRVDGA